MDQSNLKYEESEINVHHQGAHLSSWVYQGKEQLFVSTEAIYQPSKAIRGGVPICFPQFGAFGPGQSHGFARNVVWQKLEAEQGNMLRFELNHNQELLTQWPYKFKAVFDALIEDNALTMSLKVKNLNNKSINFTAALHTYFKVNSIKKSAVEGLQTCEFWDNGTAFEQRQNQQQNTLTFNQMIDRVYFNTANTNKPLSLIDGDSTRHIESQGFADTVIWNPWQEGATAFADMADDEYQQMLCIESANVQAPIHLEPGEDWQGQQKITVVNA